jgi:hypothetical protein
LPMSFEEFLSDGLSDDVHRARAVDRDPAAEWLARIGGLRGCSGV